MFHQITLETKREKVYQEEEMYSSSEAEEEMYSSSEAEEEMYSSSEDELQPAENRFQNMVGAVGRSGNSMGSAIMRGGRSLRKTAKKKGGASKGLMRKWNEKRGKIKETPLNHVEWNVEDKHNLVYKLFKKYHGQVEDFQEKGKSRSKVTGKKAWKMYFAGKDPFVQFEVFKYWISSHKWKSTVTVLKALRLWTHLQNCLSNSLPRPPAYQPQQPAYQPQQPVYQQPAPTYQQPALPPQAPVLPPQAPVLQPQALPPVLPPQAPAYQPQALPPSLPPQAPALPPRQ